MKELMIEVERIVRPLRALARRKDRIREELLAHWAEVFAEERARGADLATALAATRARFGDSRQVTRELEESLSWGDRVAFVLARLFDRRGRESEPRWLLRTSAMIFGLSLASLIVFPITWMLGSHINQMDLGMRLRVVLGFGFALAIEFFLLGLICLRLRDAVLRRPGERRRGGKACAWGAVASLVFLAWPPAVALVTVGDWRTGLDILNAYWLLAALAVPSIAAVVIVSDGPWQHRHAEWMSLQIPLED